MKILVTADYFLPTKRGGGPIRSLVNFADRFGGEHEIYLVTRDRDAPNESAYKDIQSGQWNDLGNAKVRYLSPQEPMRKVLCEIVNEIAPETIYMNSLFSPLTRAVLLNRRFKSTLPRAMLLLAVRGELNPGALEIKPIRKRVFIELGKRIGVFRNVRFHASSNDEASVTKKHFPKNDSVVAMNVPAPVMGTERHRPDGKPRYVFIARVAPIKNLEIALNAIISLRRENASFNGILEIHGNVTDKQYGETIADLVARCGESAKLHGAYQHEQVWEILNEASFSVLPSRGENFAHSIYESAAVGVPFLVSDRTPWTEMAHDGAGWAVPIDDLDGWKNAFAASASMSESDYLKMSKHCIDSAKQMRDLAHQQHDQLFAEHAQ